MESKLHLFLPQRPNYLNDFAVKVCYYLDLFQYDAELIVEYPRKIAGDYHGQCWGDSERVDLVVAHQSMGEGLTRKEKMLALAHELVHAEQYLSGRLKDQESSPDNYTVIWNRRKIVWRDDLPTEEQPWEVEAYGREEEIYEECR